jgi:hypothetical protein
MLAGAVLLVMRAMRAFAFPWSGIGEDLESFEDAVAFLRLWWFPIIFLPSAEFCFSFTSGPLARRRSPPTARCVLSSTA